MADDSRYSGPGGRGTLKGYNSMQLQMGISPQNYAPQPLPTLPAPPSPMQASQMLLQQSRMTMSPMPRPQTHGMLDGMNPQFSSPAFGSRRAMARQSAVHAQDSYIRGAQSMAGWGARMGGGMLASTAGGLVGGPMGAFAAGAAFDASMGQSLQNGVGSVFSPITNRRLHGLQMQQQSQMHIRSGRDMSGSGQGLSMQAAQRTTNSIRNMAQDSDFQSSTNEMFNTQDVMKISRMASGMGMLDQAGTSDQITRDIKKISKSLSNFMKLAGEPDIQQAMQQMSQMKDMGMSFPEISSATNNARQFARMAGVDTRVMMENGLHGAQTYQIQGLSGAAGMNAAMGAQGFAGLAAGSMTNRQLSMSGGQAGVADTLMRASTNAATMDVLLPSILSRQNGRLGIDQNALNDVLSGDQNIQQIIQQGASNMRTLDQGQTPGRTIQDLATQRRELQDQAQRSMSPEMQMLLPMIIAQRTAASSPNINMGGALRMMGHPEHQARTMELMAESPEFKRGLIQQQQVSAIERREGRQQSREHTADAARTPEWVRNAGAWSDMGGRSRGAIDSITNMFARAQDIEEEIETRGGRVQRVHQRDPARTELGDARRRDRTRSDPSRFLGGGEDSTRDENVGRAVEASMHAMSNMIPGLVGPQGFGLTQGARGGELLHQTVARQEDIVTRGLMAVGVLRQDPQEVRARADEIQTLGNMAAQVNNSNTRERVTGRQRAITAINNTRGVSGLGAMDPSKRRRMTAQSTSAIRAYLDGQTTVGMHTGSVSMGAMTEAVRSRLLAEGHSPEDVRALTQPDAMAHAMTEGRGAYTAAQQTEIDRMEQGGAEIGAQTRGQTVEALRQGSIRRHESVMEMVGMEDGFFSGVNPEDQSNVRDLLGGGGNQARMGAALAAMQSGDEATKMAGQEERARLVEELGEDAVAEMETAAQSQLGNLDANARRNLGNSIGSRGIDNVVKAFGQADDQDAIAINSAAMSSLVGGNTDVRDRMQAALREGNEGQAATILRSYAENERGLTSENRVRLKRIANADDFSSSLTGAIDSQIAGAEEISGGTGMSGADDMAALMGALDSFGSAPGGGLTQGVGEGTIATPGNFEEAVVMFSEATRDLKVAAEQFAGDRETSGLSVDTLQASPLNIFAGMFD